MKISKLLLSPLLITAFSLLLPSGVFSQTDIAVTTDEKRNKLIGYMLSKQLPSIHFSDKQVNDKLAEAIFDLYLKQLDFQKRFLIKDDADRLRSFTCTIDDNLLRGTSDSMSGQHSVSTKGTNCHGNQLPHQRLGCRGNVLLGLIWLL